MGDWLGLLSLQPAAYAFCCATLGFTTMICNPSLESCILLICNSDCYSYGPLFIFEENVSAQ